MTDGESEVATKRLVGKGFSGVIPSSAPGDVILRALRTVAHGELWVGRRLMSEMIREFVTAKELNLTSREAEILSLVKVGHSNSQIADLLFISRDTVRWHLRSVYRKSTPPTGPNWRGSRKASK
jgi:DNA-binding NarL/FixJ family response regulator